MSSIIKHIVFFFLVTGFISGNAQCPQIKNYTVDNGLLSSEVFHVIQDRQGYIWIASDQGVSRFDGYSFKNFTNLDGLPDKTVLELFEDYKGRIWFIPLSGVLSYIEKDTIVPYRFNHVIESYNNKKYYPIKKSFYVDATDNLYMGIYKKNIIRISGKGDLKEITPPYKGSSIIHTTPEGAMVYSAILRENLYPVVTNPYIEKDTIPIKREIKGNRSFALQTKNYSVYTYYNKALVIKNTGKHKTYDLPHEIIWMSEGMNESIWMGLRNNGVIHFQSNQFSTREHHLLKNLSVSSVCKDNEGGMWFTTLENGLYYYPSLDFKVLQITDNKQQEQIHQLEITEGNLWIHCNNGCFYKYDTEKLTKFQYQKPLHHQTSSLFFYMNDTVFASDGLSGTYMVTGNTVKKIEINNLTSAILLNKKDLLFFKRWNIYKFEKNKVSTLLTTDKFTIVYDVEKINENKILIGTDVGLYEFEYNTKTIKPYLTDSILKQRINCIVKNKNNTYYLGTKGRGLIIIKDSVIQNFTQKDGLAGNSVNSIEIDDDIIWLSTNNGLTRLVNKNGVIDKKSIDIFNNGHGLLTNETKDIKIYKDHVYVATNKGLNYFHKNIRSYKTNVRITQLLINNKQSTWNESIKLKHNENNIKISFHAINYQRNLPIIYKYRLKGLDSVWYKTSDTWVSYSSLTSGKYTFEVSAINSHGRLSEETQQVTFTITKPYYKTTLFLILMILTTATIISTIFYIFLKARIREAAKRGNIELELNKSRQQALNAQMNPHFIYNSLNSVQNYILKNDRFSGSQYLSKLGNLMRAVLNNSQKEFITLAEEIEALEEYIDLELLRFRNSFESSIEIDPDLNLSEIKVPPLILQPYTENAIHHGLRMKEGNKKLTIKLFRSNNTIHLQIIDNGIGIKKHREQFAHIGKHHKSQGNDITKKRLILFDILYANQIEVKTGEAFPEDTYNKGTKIDISFNIDNFI